MSNYRVELVEIRKKKGKEFLHIKILDKMIGFLEDEDINMDVKEGDIISCSITQKGKFFDGANLKVVDEDTEDLIIETELKIDQIIGQKEGQYSNENQSKLHAGPRIYHFEVKDTSRGDKYLVITEQSGKKRNRIFIFEDHAEGFSEKVNQFLKKLKH